MVCDDDLDGDLDFEETAEDCVCDDDLDGDLDFGLVETDEDVVVFEVDLGGDLDLRLEETDEDCVREDFEE